MSAQCVVIMWSLTLSLVCESCTAVLIVRLMAVAHRDLTADALMHLAPDANLVLSLR